MQKANEPEKSEQQLREDEILRRMLKTPPTPHKPLGKRKPRVKKPDSAK